MIVWKVEFENLRVACFECGKIGHSSDSCPLLHPAASPAALPLLCGAWMLVRRKSRRNLRDQDKKGKQESEAGIPGSGKDGKNGQRPQAGLLEGEMLTSAH
ncbi:unnamed protein product [Linum trigynum]|uniref:CCHC-type domain-containing protein n=1 Tax=Linum trigynum TaxID=586398 RepID=A0AAV2FC68_9ROSI